MLSMTGYSRVQQEGELGQLTVELKSVNSRFLDLQIRLPHDLGAFEPTSRQQMMRSISRGKVSLFCRFDPNPNALAYDINHSLLDLLIETCHLRNEEPQVSQLLQISGVVIPKNRSETESELGEFFLKVLDTAIVDFNRFRKTEGLALKLALTEISHRLNSNLSQVANRKERAVQEYREKLSERLQALLEGKSTSLDPARLEFEVSLLAEKSDITEEIKRLESHFQQLDQLLKSSEKKSIGKQLEFLQQEIGREINTMASKTRDVEMVTFLLDMKRDSERLKEQAANIE